MAGPKESMASKRKGAPNGRRHRKDRAVRLPDRIAVACPAGTRGRIEKAAAVIEEAEAEGYRPTLRRVFYALVAEGKTPNTTQAYKRLSWTLDEARWEGLLPFDALDDRARPVSVAPAWESPA